MIRVLARSLHDEVHLKPSQLQLTQSSPFLTAGVDNGVTHELIIIQCHSTLMCLVRSILVSSHTTPFRYHAPLPQARARTDEPKSPRSQRGEAKGGDGWMAKETKDSPPKSLGVVFNSNTSQQEPIKADPSLPTFLARLRGWCEFLFEPSDHFGR